MLKIVHPVCCGVDVHKKFIVATIASTNSFNVTSYLYGRFKTTNEDLEKFKVWLAANNCIEVCMESTGVYWIPVYNILESKPCVPCIVVNDATNDATNAIKITLANPKYVKAVKGKKTDKNDSRWIADLHKHGLVPGSYIPPKEIRMLRDLCRYRTKLVGNRSSEKNRVQNALTVSNIALPNFVSDTFGKTSQAIIEYILTCDVFDPEYCKTLIHPTIKASPDEIIKSILGYKFSPEQATKIRVSKEHLGAIEKCLGTIDKSIDEFAKPFESQIKILATMPGITDKSATRIISEIGVDMSVFTSSKHLCSWAGLTPQNNESAGKKKSTKISRAGVFLKPLLVQCANAAIKDKKNPYFANKYHSIKKRRGHKKAIIAVARMMLTCAYNMIAYGESFAPSDSIASDIPPDILEKRNKQKIDAAIAFLNKNGISVVDPSKPITLTA